VFGEEDEHADPRHGLQSEERTAREGRKRDAGQVGGRDEQPTQGEKGGADGGEQGGRFHLQRRASISPAN